MRIRVGCRFEYEASADTPALWQVRPRVDGPQMVVSSTWGSTPFAPFHSYVDGFGNLCDRLILPQGQSSLRYDALVEVPAS